MASIDEQINQNNARITNLNYQIADLESSATSWQASSDSDVCNQKLKGKRSECETEKARKASVAVERRNQVAPLKSMITNLEADNRELTKQRESESQAIINLSMRGETMASVQTKATADAQAVVLVADANANTIEKTADVKAAADSMNNKTKTAFTIGIGIFLFVVMAFLVYQKMKKPKA